MGIWNVDLAHVGKVGVSHYSWRAAFYVLVAASWLSLGSFLSLSLFSLPFFFCPVDAVHSWLSVPLSSQGIPNPLHGEGKVSHSLYSPNRICIPQNAVTMSGHFLHRLFYLVHLKSLRNGDTSSHSDSLFRLFTKQY